MRRRCGLRGLAVRLDVFAILFQAILFGWHHHDLVSAGGQPSHPIVHAAGAATHPVADEDGCEICQTLHHQTAASSNGANAPLAGLAASPSVTADPIFIVLTLALAFRARAPPLV